MWQRSKPQAHGYGIEQTEAKCIKSYTVAVGARIMQSFMNQRSELS